MLSHCHGNEPAWQAIAMRRHGMATACNAMAVRRGAQHSSCRNLIAYERHKQSNAERLHCNGGSAVEVQCSAVALAFLCHATRKQCAGMACRGVLWQPVGNGVAGKMRCLQMQCQWLCYDSPVQWYYKPTATNISMHVLLRFASSMAAAHMPKRLLTLHGRRHGNGSAVLLNCKAMQCKAKTTLCALQWHANTNARAIAKAMRFNVIPNDWHSNGMTIH